MPVAFRSIVWICGRSLAGIAGSNPVVREGISVVSVECWQVDVCEKERSVVQRITSERVDMWVLGGKLKSAVV
jgi:hypothetical protein